MGFRKHSQKQLYTVMCGPVSTASHSQPVRKTSLTCSGDKFVVGINFKVKYMLEMEEMLICTVYICLG